MENTKGWSVSVEAGTATAGIDEEAADRFAEQLKNAHGTATAGDHMVGGTISVDADTVDEAFALARSVFDQALEEVGIPAELRHFELTREDELERRLEKPNFPELMGVAELAKLLGVSRQRVSELARSETFPQPVARLASGPVWTASSVAAFDKGWLRRSGRPSVAADANMILATLGMDSTARAELRTEDTVAFVDAATGEDIETLDAEDVRILRNLVAHGSPGRTLLQVAADLRVTNPRLVESIQKLEAMLRHRTTHAGTGTTGVGGR